MNIAEENNLDLIFFSSHIEYHASLVLNYTTTILGYSHKISTLLVNLVSC